MAREAPQPATRSGWEAVLDRIDRRVIYLGLLLFTLVPLRFPLPLPVYVTPPAASLHAAIEALPTEKVVFVASNWDADTYAENEPQTIALFRHLLRRRLKFVLFSVTAATAPQFGQNALDEALQNEFPAGPGPDGYPAYGVHYLNAGYKVRAKPWIRSLVQDPGAALNADWKAQPIRSFPLFQGLTSMPAAASMLIDITASDTTEDFIPLVGAEGVPISLACTAVSAPEQYPFLATGQLKGLLTGMRGAAEYETLLGYKGRATRMMGGQSFAHLYIFLLIVLGNVAVIRRSLRRRRAS